MMALQCGTDCFLLFGLKIPIVGVRGGGKDGKDSASKTFAIPKLRIPSTRLDILPFDKSFYVIHMITALSPS